jgi:plastocyanin
MRKLLFALVVGSIAAAVPLIGGTRGGVTAAVSGTVRVQARPGTPPATPIVYAEPLDAPAPKRPGTFTLAQKGKSFVPRVLAVPVGSTINFPNEDQIFHNVFSLSPPQPFDLGLYRAGASKAQTFDQPATLRVFCNIHPQMTAMIAVVPTPFVTLADASTGAFSLDLPPGRYKLTAMSERAAPISQDVKVGASTKAELTLDESQFVQTQHTNKFGKEYSKDAYAPGKN